jgi:hypothetical protein
MRFLFSVFFLCLSLLSSPHFSEAAEAVSDAARCFDSSTAGATYYAKMKTEMAGLVRLKVKGSNVRVRSGAGTSFEITQVAQLGDIFFAKKEPVKGADGLSWYEIAGALYSGEDTVAVKLENCFICADFVTPGPLTRETRDYMGDEGFIKRHIYRVFPVDLNVFTLDRDTPFRPAPESPLVTDTTKDILPAGTRLPQGFYAVSEDGYLEFSAEAALPEGNKMTIGWIRFADYARLNFGRHEKEMREVLDTVARSYRGKVKNEL